MKMSDLISPADLMIDVRLANKSLLLKALAAKAAISLGLSLEQVGGHFCVKNRLYRNDRFLTQRGQSAKGQPLLIEVEFSERIVRGACGAPSAPLVVSATVAYLLPVHRKKR
jgi:hypothetical protein